ncbi:hypothetical protein BP5796_04829 [Coleophoma crateriformis]|uniref:Uncharacterized protein n=1 Tax=Coleophoma crateriformis TaxID=565419 RepID=A0A3D8SC48_9HELO|nr:hypothetical protein BP5796_04829 [Coleophoma crateriformis]
MFQSKGPLLAVSAIGAVVAGNFLIKPSRHDSIARGMSAQLDDINSKMHLGQVVQDKWDTILDRTSLMEEAKKRKPWNMTASERAAEAKRLQGSNA